MPIYVYRCTECAQEVELIHGIHADGPTTCEVCGGAMRKALTTPAIHFKGSGWAKKDAQAASKAKASSAATAGKSDAADAKPAADSASGSAASSSSEVSAATTASGDGKSTAKGATPPKTAASKTTE